MRIVEIDEKSELLKELSEIRSNEQGKFIDLGLVDIGSETDFSDKNIVFGNLTLKAIGEFIEYCKSAEKKECFIIFSRKIDSELLKEISKGIDLKENLLLVGAGNLSGSEISFIAENKIRKISLNQIEIDLENLTDSIMEFASGKELLLGLDFSVLDLFEPGGLSGREAIYILGRMGMMKNLKVACFSGRIESERERKLAAKLAAELF